MKKEKTLITCYRHRLNLEKAEFSFWSDGSSHAAFIIELSYLRYRDYMKQSIICSISFFIRWKNISLWFCKGPLRSPKESFSYKKMSWFYFLILGHDLGKPKLNVFTQKIWSLDWVRLRGCQRNNNWLPFWSKWNKYFKVSIARKRECNDFDFISKDLKKINEHMIKWTQITDNY